MGPCDQCEYSVFTKTKIGAISAHCYRHAPIANPENSQALWPCLLREQAERGCGDFKASWSALEKESES